MPPGVIAGLYEHEAEVVVGFCEPGLEADRFTELGGHRAAVGARAAEQAAKDVMGVGSAGVRGERLAEGSDGRSQSGAGSQGPGRFSPVSSCPIALSRSAARRYVIPRST